MKKSSILRTIAVVVLSILGLVGSVVCLLGSPFLITHGINVYRLARVERAYRQVRHPPGTMRIKYAADIGDPGGSSDRCLMFAGELRLHNGDWQAIQESYKGQGVNVWYFEHEIAHTDDMVVLPFGYDHVREFSRWKAGQASQMSNLYLVSMSGDCLNWFP